MYHLIKQYTRPLALILFLGAGLLAVTTSPAQAQMNIKPGVRAGADFMTIGGDDTDDLDSRTGFLIGGFALIDLGGPIALQPEITYIQKGASFELTSRGTTVTGTTKLNYVEIPVLAKYQVPASGFSPSIFAGPALGFNMTAEVEAESGGQTSTGDVSDEFTGTDFGIYVGAGADFSMSLGTLSVDARYNLGLSNIVDTDADVFQNNQGFMITAGLAF